MSIPSEVVQFTAQLFCVATLFAMGLGVTLEDVEAPFRNLLALVIIVAVTNLLTPLLGVLIIMAATVLQGGIFADLAKAIVPLTGGQKLGFLLIMLAAGSLLAPMLAEVAGVQGKFARGIMVALVGISTVVIPMELALLAQITKVLDEYGAVFDGGRIFTTLFVYQLLPLAVGILLNARYAVIAARLRPLMTQFAGLTFVTVLALASAGGYVQLVAELPAEPPALIAQLVKTLEGLPLVGQLIDGLSTIITLALPYAMFAAVAALLLVIGNYTGVAVRNLVKLPAPAPAPSPAPAPPPSPEIPHTLAMTTAVRGVTLALMVAISVLGTQSATLPATLATILVFHLVSLLVAAHQAVQWGKPAPMPSE